MKTPEQWLDSILTADIPAQYDSTLLHLIQAIQKDAANLNTTRSCIIACTACKELINVVLEKDGHVVTTSLGVKDKPEYHLIPPQTKTIYT